MRNITIILVFSFISLSVYTQKDSRILSENEVSSIFTNDLKVDLGIHFPIFRVYNYTDKSGNYFLVLTEREYKKENDSPLNDSIKGYCILETDREYSVIWQMKDFILKINNVDTPEYSIWFWTKYFDLLDFDKDGLIDPIVIYGTSGMNGTSDGRIKILVYYKGVKRAIRHQNGTLDFERNTQVDKEFYNLPEKIQEHVRNLMEKMISNNHAIFPNGFRESMDARQTYFDENQ